MTILYIKGGRQPWSEIAVGNLKRETRTSSLVMGDLSLRSSDAAMDSYHTANQRFGSCLGAMHLRCQG